MARSVSGRTGAESESSDAAACSTAVPRAWASFVSCFAEYAVGGYVLPPHDSSSGGRSDWIRSSAHDQVRGDVHPQRRPIVSDPIKPKSSAAQTQTALATDREAADDAARRDALASALRHGAGNLEQPQQAQPSSSPVAGRVVALGDVHGDMDKTREALRIAGLIDGKDRWVGGNTVLVQVGDVLDRGGDELQILHLLQRLKHEAAAAGGAVHTLLGNHETGNADGYLRYATSAGLRDFRRWAAWQRWANAIMARCDAPAAAAAGTPPPAAPPDPLDHVPESVKLEKRARLAALSPNGPITRRFLADNPVTLQLGGSLFVHGGVLPHHVEYGLDRINREAREWLLTPTPPIDGQHFTGRSHLGHGPRFIYSGSAIVWAREYSHSDPADCRCDVLDRTLAMLPSVDRMIMGHTIQEEERGVNAVCEGRAVRVDVGMSAGCGGAKPEVLEILRERNGREVLRVLSRNGSRLLERQGPQYQSQPQQQPLGQEHHQHRVTIEVQ